MVTYGVDHINEYKNLLADGRVALLTSATGRSSENQSTISLLMELCHLTALLEPEHGLRGAHAAGAATENSVDPETGLPVYSLSSAGSKHLSREMLEAFDHSLLYVGGLRRRRQTAGRLRPSQSTWRRGR